MYFSLSLHTRNKSNCIYFRFLFYSHCFVVYVSWKRSSQSPGIFYVFFASFFFRFFFHGVHLATTNRLAHLCVNYVSSLVDDVRFCSAQFSMCALRDWCFRERLSVYLCIHEMLSFCTASVTGLNYAIYDSQKENIQISTVLFHHRFQEFK